MNQRYDLLLAGGDVIDVGGGNMGRLDVAVADGRVVAVGADLPGHAGTVVNIGAQQSALDRRERAVRALLSKPLVGLDGLAEQFPRS